jgi:type I restriction enzyme, S subunit
MTKRDQVQIRRLFKVVSGGTPTSDADYWAGDVQWATPVDLGVFNGAILGATQRTLTDAGLRAGSSAVPAGSLVLSTRAPIGYVSQTTGLTAFNQGCKGLVPHGEVDIRYYRYVLTSQKDALTAAGQGSTFLELSSDALASFPVPVLELRAQRALANYLDSETARIDALIAKKTRQVELGLLRLQIKAHSLTEGSPLVPLRRLVRSVRTGTTPPPEVVAELQQDGDVPWLSPGDVGDALAVKPAARKVQARAVRQRYCPPFAADSTLVVGIGATAGRVAHLNDPATGNQQMTCVLAAEPLVPRFLSWSLWARQDELRATAPYTTLPILSNDFLRSFAIWCPPTEEQWKIVRELDSNALTTEALCAALGRQIALLHEHRRALIATALSGDFEVSGEA